MFGRFMLLDPETPLAVLPNLQDYDAVQSEQAADNYILALHANHRMRFVLADGPMDWTVQEHLAAHPTDEDRAALANTIVAHMAYNTRIAYETHAEAAFALAGLDSPEEDMVNDIVPMPVEGGDNEVTAEEEQAQNMTVSTQVPEYTGLYSTLSQARDVIYRPQELRKLDLDIEHDDVKSVNDLVGAYVQKVYHAIRSLPAGARGAKRFEGRVGKMEHPEDVITSISSMVVQQVLQLHAAGDHLRADQVKKATQQDLTMTSSQRLEAIAQVLEHNKLIAYDIIEGFDKIALFVAMPTGIVAEKVRFALQNAGRTRTRNVRDNGEHEDEADDEDIDAGENEQQQPGPKAQKKGTGRVKIPSAPKTRTAKSKTAAIAEDDEDHDADVDRTPVLKAMNTRATAGRGTAATKRKRAMADEGGDDQETKGGAEEDGDGDKDMTMASPGNTETKGSGRNLRKRFNKR